MKLVTVAWFFLILFLALVSESKSDCVCDAEVHGTETRIVDAQDGQTGARIAVNSADGGYFIGWSTVRRLSDNTQATLVEGQVFDRSLNPISSRVTFVNNPNHSSGDAVSIGAAAFHPILREYFVVTAEVKFDSNGNKYEQLRGHILSDRNELKATNIPIADTKSRLGSFFSVNRIDVIYNSVNREYVVKHQTFFQGQPKTILQRFNERGIRIGGKTIFLKEGDLRFNFQANRFLFAYSHIVSNQFEIKTQLLDAQLERIGIQKTILSVPYDFSNLTAFTGPFPVYNPARRKFVVFWYQGPWTDSVIHAASINVDGEIENAIPTGIHRPIDEIRFNPITKGYILIPNASKVTRISSSYQITSEFSFSCQRPPTGLPTLVYNRNIPEFLVVWFYPTRYGANNDLFARRVAASIPANACDP